jgi:hypothetical protein
MRGRIALASAIGAGLLTYWVADVQPGAPRLPAGEEIRISREPCGESCPAYTLAVTPAGRLDFNGVRHTAVQGSRSRTVGRAAYERLRLALAPLRPGTGGERVLRCDAAGDDPAQVTIEWLSARGGRTALRYRLDCREPAEVQLEHTVQSLLEGLQVEGWAAAKGSSSDVASVEAKHSGHARPEPG